MLLLFNIGRSESPALSDTVFHISPKAALIRSAFVPGWGQVYNKKPLKGLVFFSAEVYFVYNFVYFNRLYGYVKDTKETVGLDAWLLLSEAEKKTKIFETTGYNLGMNTWRPREKRNKNGWWCLGTYIFGMLDAVVDAHLINFPHGDVELSMNGQTINYSISFGF